ncbi:MAG: hypothetical protein KDC87_08925 [Planctomycetes bacterium]|nr:hypothetical protein [Planctomycetota bacterium]
MYKPTIAAVAVLFACCTPYRDRLDSPAMRAAADRGSSPTPRASFGGSHPSSTRPEEHPWSATLGWRTLSLDYTFHHSTHRDDQFLRDAGVPGSAGTTELRRLEFLAFGVGYTRPLTESLFLKSDLGMLFGANGTGHQNANDDRPAANAAFVYSDASFGCFGSVGLAYEVGPFYLGGEVQLAGLWVDSGWDRFSR